MIQNILMCSILKVFQAVHVFVRVRAYACVRVRVCVRVLEVINDTKHANVFESESFPTHERENNWFD